MAATHLGLLELAKWIPEAWFRDLYRDIDRYLFVDAQKSEDLAKGIKLLYKTEIIEMDSVLEEAAFEYVAWQIYGHRLFHYKPCSETNSEYFQSCGRAFTKAFLEFERKYTDKMAALNA